MSNCEVITNYQRYFSDTIAITTHFTVYSRLPWLHALNLFKNVDA